MNPLGSISVQTIESVFRRLVKSQWLVPTTIIFLGLCLRIYHIDHESVGYDEAFSLNVTQMQWNTMVGTIIRDFVHPPLHYFVLRAWLKFFGFGVLPARMLSAIFGTLAIVLMYLLGSHLFGRRTAAFSSLFLAVSQLGVMFSQEARPYAMLLFLSLSSSYLFLLALRGRRPFAWWGFVCLSTLMIYTHYWGVFVIASLVLYAIVYRKRYFVPISWWIGGTAMVLAFYLPWIASGVVRQALIDNKTLPAQQGPWFTVHWWTFLSAINSFNNGKTKGLLESSTPWALFVGCVLFSAPMVLALKGLVSKRPSEVHGREQEGVMFTTILWLLPMFLIIGLGVLNVQYNVRYVSFCAAPYYILVARGFSLLKSGSLARILLVLVLIYSGYSLRANYFIPWKEDFRSAIAHIAREYKEGDCSVFSPFSDVIPPQWSVTVGSRLAGLKYTTPDAAASGRVSCNRIWVVAMTFDANPWVENQREAAEQKLESTLSRMEQEHYFWLDVDLYAPQEH